MTAAKAHVIQDSVCCVQDHSSARMEQANGRGQNANYMQREGLGAGQEMNAQGTAEAERASNNFDDALCSCTDLMNEH